MHKAEFRAFPSGQRQVTTVIITNDQVEVARGASICMPNDTFSSDLGRHKAIAHALKAAGFSREDRIRIREDIGL